MGRAHSRQISRPIYLRQRLPFKGSTINPGREQANKRGYTSLASIFPPGAQLLCTLRAPQPARSVMCGSASDPSAAPGEEPPSLSLLAQTTASFSPPTEAGSLILPLDQDLSHFLEWFCGCLPAFSSSTTLPSPGGEGGKSGAGLGGTGEGRREVPTGRGEQDWKRRVRFLGRQAALCLDFPICTMGLHSFFSTNIYMPDLVLNALPSHHEDKTLP